MTLPVEFRSDLEKAIEILKNVGCGEVYLFGSLATGSSVSSDTDLDIAIRGLPKSKFFATYGKLLISLEHNVDLVPLDYELPFATFLTSRGKLERVA